MKIKASAATFLVATLTILFFQNCAEVNLRKGPLVELSLSSMQASVCSAGNQNPSGLPASSIIEFNIMNLTAKAKTGGIVADSDMDGIEDSADPYPDYARANSFNILDSVCKIFGGAQLCSPPPNCQAGAAITYGLTSCESQMINTKGQYDTDHDLIPDILEVINGTSPVHADSLEDSDHDLISNLAELHRGSSPIDPANPQAKDFVSFEKQLDPRGCGSGQQAWDIKINFIPLIPVLAYEPDGNEIDRNYLFHKKNENILFVYFISQTEETNPRRILWGQYIKIPLEQGHPAQLIKLENFRKLGETTLVDGL